MIKYLVFLGSAWVQLSRTGKKWISVIVAIRLVLPDLVTYIYINFNFTLEVAGNNKIALFKLYIYCNSSATLPCQAQADQFLIKNHTN